MKQPRKKFRIFAQDRFIWDETSSGRTESEKRVMGETWAVSPAQALAFWKYRNNWTDADEYCEYGGESSRTTILWAEAV